MWAPVGRTLCLLGSALPLQRHQSVRLSAPGEVVGIDLGTTSSAVAVILPRADGPPTAEMVPDEAGSTTIPSRVIYRNGGIAVEDGTYIAPTALSSTKRLIGRTFSEVRDSRPVRALFSDSLLSLPDGSAGLRLSESGRVEESARDNTPLGDDDSDDTNKSDDGPVTDARCSPVDVAAALLHALLVRSENMCGVRARRAIVGVPAHFTEPQRSATIAAAEQAGLETVRLLEEPVAAALAYGVGRGAGEELVLVFDLGGGTLDVSLLRVGGGTAEVLSSSGDAWLGGDDFDIAIAR